ncbi:MAG: TRAP transporter small permease [Deltaproteobacteria bacterium]|nr:TRAP transporter small permease [Deltaproteobacteria bacterium]MBW2083164.1 TRAP transporter small permease [Deltaproteobacteria bacterium]
MSWLDKALRYVETGMAILAGLLLVIMTVSIGMSITLRTLNLQVPLWSVQFNEYSLLWITFLGAAWLLRKGRHVSLDIVTRRLRKGDVGKLQIIHAVFGLVVCGVLTLYSGAVTWNLFQRGVMDVRAVDVPKYLILLVVFLGLLMLTMEFLRNLVVGAHRLRRDK